MRKRHPNPRLAKIHRNYTVAEVATLFSVHRQTVRRWIKSGLPTVDTKRPTLILGSQLATFIGNRRKANKQTCKPGEIYCVRCKEPKKPAGDMVDCEQQTAILGNLIGLCPDCETLMYRRVNITRLDEVRGDLSITMLEAVEQINEINQPSINSHFK